MKLFVGVIIVAVIIFAVLLAFNLIFSSDGENIVNGFDADKIPIGLTDTLESEMKDIEPVNETKTIDSKNDDWKKVAFSEMYDDSGELLAKYNETKIRIYVEDIPEYSHNSITKQVVDDAVASWSEANPELDFAIIDDIRLSNIDIKWVSNIHTKPIGKITVQPVGEVYTKPIHYTLGITETTVTRYGNHEQVHHEIQIDLLDSDCNKQEIFWDVDTVTDTVKHEIGHTLGLEHSSDENNLMYGEDGIAKMDNKGFVVPELISEFQYIGEKEAQEEVEFYENKLNVELGLMGWTVDDWESERTTNNGPWIDKINLIIGDLNPVVDKYNCFLLTR